MSEQPVEPGRIPTHVSLDELLVALQPLLDLVGISKNEVYTDPAIRIGSECGIELWVAPGEGEERPKGVRDEGHPLDEFAEWKRQIQVPVVEWMQ